MTVDGVVAARPGIDDVRRFWDAQPLLAGESIHAPGERAFFDELASIKLYELSGRVDPIFTDGVAPGRDVLDVGCGPGFWVRWFAAMGARVTACDLSEVAVRLTRQHLAFHGLDADVRVGNAEALPFEASSFDHLNCQGVIHHTPDPVASVREFHRVLRPGGTLSLSVYYRALPLRVPWLYRIVSRATRSWLGLRGRGRERMMHAADATELVRLYDGRDNPTGVAFTRKELKELLREHFEVLELRRVGLPRRILPLRMPDGAHRVLSRAFGLMLVARCRKA